MRLFIRSLAMVFAATLGAFAGSASYAQSASAEASRQLELVRGERDFLSIRLRGGESRAEVGVQVPEPAQVELIITDRRLVSKTSNSLTKKSYASTALYVVDPDGTERRVRLVTRGRVSNVSFFAPEAGRYQLVYVAPGQPAGEVSFQFTGLTPKAPERLNITPIDRVYSQGEVGVQLAPGETAYVPFEAQAERWIGFTVEGSGRGILDLEMAVSVGAPGSEEIAQSGSNAGNRIRPTLVFASTKDQQHTLVLTRRETSTRGGSLSSSPETFTITHQALNPQSANIWSQLGAEGPGADFSIELGSAFSYTRSPLRFDNVQFFKGYSFGTSFVKDAILNDQIVTIDIRSDDLSPTLQLGYQTPFGFLVIDAPGDRAYDEQETSYTITLSRDLLDASFDDPTGPKFDGWWDNLRLKAISDFGEFGEFAMTVNVKDRLGLNAPPPDPVRDEPAE
ncbi:MAG: hypothetical protein AAFZ11_08230 [Pseudomonadota bacterium]